MINRYPPNATQLRNECFLEIKNRVSGSWPFWLAIGFISIVFLFGGGARRDILTLPLVRAAAALTCAASMFTIEVRHLRRHRIALVCVIAIAALIALHLIPLPPTLWILLPGREFVQANDRLAHLGAVWRPLTLAPGETWNSLYSLLVPLAVLLCGIQLELGQLRRLILAIVAIGIVSGLIGIMQVIGDTRGPLYFYRITNVGSAVGLFSNRNHHAIFLATLFPMISWLAGRRTANFERARIRSWLCALASVILVPIILVAGSRAGLILGILGILGAWRLYRPVAAGRAARRGPSRFDLRAPFVALAMLLMGVMTFLVSRADAVSRLTDNGEQGELRLKFWGPILALGWKYFPVGAGIGSFVEVYRMGEPDKLLDPSYLNHAHNELLEIWLTAGIPGLVVALPVAIVLTVASVAALRGSALAKPAGDLRALGGLTVLILLLGSIADYPLRTPSLAALMVVAILWLCAPTDELTGKPLEKGQAFV